MSCPAPSAPNGQAHLAFDRAIALAPDNQVPGYHKMISLAGKGDFASARTLLEECDHCSLVDAYCLFLAAIQDGSASKIQKAMDMYARRAERYVAAGGSPDNVSTPDEYQDMIEIFIHRRGNELGLRKWMIGAQPSMVIASAYAHIGDTDSAIAMLHELHRRSAFLESFELVSHGGPLALPDDFVLTPQYREIWETAGMKKLASIRSGNGRSEGLPPI